MRKKIRSQLFCFMLSVFVGMNILLLPAATYAEDASEWASQEDIDQGNVVSEHQHADSSFLYDTSLSELETADTYYDAQYVQVVGEVIGDAIKDGLGGEYVWITLEDKGGLHPISVHLTKTQASQIHFFGSHNTIGSTIQVRGIYHLVCTDHYGSSDIHAEEISVLEEGFVCSDSFIIEDFQLGAVVVCFGICLYIFYRLLREKLY